MEIKEMVDLLEDIVCDFCIHNNECPHGVICCGGNPIEPPCYAEGYERILDIEKMEKLLIEEGLIMPDIKGAWFNRVKGITVVKWEDNTITRVAVRGEDNFDEEKGIALCFMKKYCGNTGKYNEILKKYITAKE